MPSPRPPLRAPPRQNARPQFAATPRFLLSQRAVSQRVVAENNDKILSKDEASSFELPNSRPASTAARDPASRRKEVIEDSGIDLDQEQDSHQQPDDENGTGDIPSSPPPDIVEMDAEIEALFGPTRHPTKRRRVSVNLPTPVIQKRKQHDFIETSSPEWPPFSLTAEPPSPSLPYRTTPQKTPQPPATPATTKPSIRNHPRFLVSSTSQPPPKPTFVLPRPPSPDQTDDSNAVLTPFSPSSRALRRHGRQRSSAPSYLPGGMASEVRTWILEMGTKREQQMQAAATFDRRGEAESLPAVNAQRYSLILRTSNVRQTALGSCGPLAFIRGQDVSSERGESADDEDSLQGARNVLLLGPPRLRQGELRTSSNRVPRLQAGDVVGVFRGLVWEVGVESNGNPVPDHEQILRRESERAPELGRWFVSMEWEVVHSA
ncbi:hypothetical protein BDV12DRAFT_162037 [Aspergillus spectabilis]